MGLILASMNDAYFISIINQWYIHAQQNIDLLKWSRFTNAMEMFDTSIEAVWVPRRGDMDYWRHAHD